MRPSVGQVFHIQLGKMLNEAAKTGSDLLPYLANINVRWGHLNLSDINCMNFSDRERDKFRLNYGDLLVCEGGEVGRCAIWKDQIDECYYQKALHRLRPIDDSVLSEYAYLFFEFGSSTGLLRSISTRSSIAHLTKEKLVEVPILLPPLPEQRKIADILSTWDRAIEVSEALLATARRQKRSLMQSLLTGKRRFPEFIGQPWKEVRLGDVGETISGGTPSSTIAKYWNGDVLWATPTDITKLSSRFIRSTARTITKEGLKASSAKLVPMGAILICTRATIGEMAIATGPISTNQGFKNLVPSKHFDSDFIYYLLQFFKNKLVRQACGSTFLELSKKDFDKLRFVMPALPEQQQIASVLNAAEEEIESHSENIHHLRTEKRALMQQLLTGKKRVVV